MDANEARARYPVGQDRNIVLAGRAHHVTVIEHERDAVIVGLHPDLLRIPYANLRWTLDK